MKKYYSFAKFQLAIDKEYGMPFGCGEEEGQVSDNFIDEPWVICPNCEDPIYMSDCEESDKDYFDCPACCFVEDDLI